MFTNACKTITEAVYGIVGYTRGGSRSIGTAFMIAPSVVVTCAHIAFRDAGISGSYQERLEVIRAPEIGRQREIAKIIATDSLRDIALLDIVNSRSNISVKLAEEMCPVGTNAGPIGFPMAETTPTERGWKFEPTLRFQGGYISSFRFLPTGTDRELPFYETDTLMYPGSSGCPGFLSDCRVFGMQAASMREPATPKNDGEEIGARAAISLWIPAADIRAFARANGLAI